MINNKLYQKIYDKIEGYIPAGWEKIVVYFEYGKASYIYSFYVKVNGKYVKCYDLEGASDDALADTFKDLEEMVSKERDREREPWTNMTMIIEKSGKMHTDFDYANLSEGTYQFKKEWKKKYLV